VSGTAGHGPTELGEVPPRVVFYTRPGCHLCDDARTVLEAVCEQLGESFDEVDITTSEDLLRRFGEEIPVTFVDGAQHDFWRVDPDRLRTALTADPKES
jgi:glutaredoxin